MPPRILPEGAARLVPAGSRLMFQVHYTPRGIPQTDRSEIGLVFADPKTIRKEMTAIAAINMDLRIPRRRRRLRGRGRASLRPGHDPLLAPAPHAPARQGVPVRGRLPRRPARGAAGRAAVRVRMAERLCPLRAQAHARGERAALPGPVRQLGRQPVEPRPQGDGHLGRADARRDARRLRRGRPGRPGPEPGRADEPEAATTAATRSRSATAPRPAPRRSTWPAPSTTGSRPR